MLLGEDSHGVNIGRTHDLQVFAGANVIVCQVGDVLETVHVVIASVNSRVGLGVVGELTVLNGDALFGCFVFEHLVRGFVTNHADGDLLAITVTVRGRTAGGEAEDKRYNCQCSNKFFHGYETFCCLGLRCATTCTVKFLCGWFPGFREGCLPIRACPAYAWVVEASHGETQGHPRNIS